MTALYTDAVGPDQIRTYGEGLASLADSHSLSLPVPTCGEWTMADLTWHLTWVQEFWAFIIANRPNGPETYTHPERPPDSALAGALRTAARKLSESLTGASPNETAWSWAQEQTVAFSLRRQTHESFIHCVDGLLAVSQPVPNIDPNMAADGIDEMVSIMLCRDPPAAPAPPASAAIQLSTTDTDDAWILGLGPTDSPGQPTMTVLQDAAPDAEISGDARGLYLWLWGRGSDAELQTDGDPSLVARLRTTISESTQ